MEHQGPTGADALRTRCPHQHRAWADTGRGIPVHQGPAGADGVREMCPQQHKHEPILLEPPWRTKALLVPMLWELGDPSSTRHELMLFQSFARTKASLMLMVCKTGAPCRRPILSGLLCLFSFLGLKPICDEFRIWASNLVRFYFIES